MPHRPPTLRLNHWLHQYLLLLLVGAVLYGVVGPLADQHFAERLPYHGHLYLSGLPRIHAHFYYADPANNPGISQQSQGIVSLPGTDAQYNPDGVAGWAWLTPASWLMLTPALLAMLIGLGPLHRPLPALVDPPDKPPRLFA